jgi:hypothetical protein
MLTIDLNGQRLASVRRDFAAKKDVVYIVESKSKDLILLCQSIPLVAQWINDHMSNGEPWDHVSVTGLFESVNRRDDNGRFGGYHKGKFRVRSVPLDQASDVFESVRTGYEKALVVAGAPHRYETTCVS